MLVFGDRIALIVDIPQLPATRVLQQQQLQCALFLLGFAVIH
jgi:hypothetical protein